MKFEIQIYYLQEHSISHAVEKNLEARKKEEYKIAQNEAIINQLVTRLKTMEDAQKKNKLMLNVMRILCKDEHS